MKYILALLLFAAAPASAQLTTSQMMGQINGMETAVPFLRISPDARAGGMGDGSVALSDDANAMHWNPANLAFSKKRFGVSGSYIPWLRALVPDINLLYGSAYYKPDSVSAVGVAVRYFSLGSMTMSGIIGTIGQFRPNEFSIDAGYSRVLFRGFSAGLTARYVRSYLVTGFTTFQTYTGQTFAVDLGASWRPQPIAAGNTRIELITAMAITNAGAKMSYNGMEGEFIPANLALAQGVLWQINDYNTINFQVQGDKFMVPSPPVYEIDPNTGNPKIVNGQYVILKGKDPDRGVMQGMFGSFGDAPYGFKEELREITFSTGAEYVYNRIFKMRAGYFYEHATKGNRKYLTFGAGVTYTKFSLDFAYLVPVNAQRSPLQNTLRFTLMYMLNGSRKSGRR